MYIILQISLVIFIYMTLVFMIAMIVKDNSVVDIFWGLGFILVAAWSIYRGSPLDLHKILMNLLVLVWGLRLSTYIFLRKQGKGEDFRYKAWRDSWKFFTLRSFFQVFMLQGILMLVISVPVYYVNYSSAANLEVVDWIGVGIFLVGFLFEAVGDYQMAIFKRKAENKDKLMTTGLWKITRHPNYFGEALIWWGIALFALNYPHGWKTLISPVILTLLLRFVSGVPMLEKKYNGRADWEEYKKKTAAFVPFVKFL